MITTQLLTEQKDINQIIPECIQLAQTEKAPLPFQYMHMPTQWYETFYSDQDLFWKKRGKNFLGIQSQLKNFILLIAKNEKKLCGVLPLAQYTLKISHSQNELLITTLAGDYVLHPFQDFVIANAERQKIIAAMLEQTAKLFQNENSLFWVGYLPEDSPNLQAIRKSCDSLKKQNLEILEAISSQRGGLWPWTLDGISTTLKKISAECEKSGKSIEGLLELTKKIAKCTPQSLLFPHTRTTFLQAIKVFLPQLKHRKCLSDLVEKLESFLKNSPMQYPYIELPDNREEYLASLSHSTRRYFRRYMKKYFDAGGSFETVLPNKITDSDIEDYIRLHLLRWGDGSAAICGEAARYHQKISRAMADQGLFLLFFATYQNKRIAVHSCFDINARREGYITGVDPAYHALRPGRLLYIQTIYDAIDKGFNRYELGAVGFDYKMSFVQKTAVAHNFFLYPKNNGARLNEIFTGFECMEPISA